MTHPTGGFPSVFDAREDLTDCLPNKKAGEGDDFYDTDSVNPQDSIRRWNSLNPKQQLCYARIITLSHMIQYGSFLRLAGFFVAPQYGWDICFRLSR